MDDQYVDYIDDEQMCTKLGVPCRHGIPCCSECSEGDAEQVMESDTDSISEDSLTTPESLEKLQ